MRVIAALTAACNQSSNRFPVVRYDEETVGRAIDSLRKRSLVRGIPRMDSRVIKFRHLLAEAMQLEARDLAVMCELMLRGPQTVGELRSRTTQVGPTSSSTACTRDTAVSSARARSFEACRPIFAAASKEAFHTGANGTGANTKLVVNLVLSLNRMALAEGLTLAAKAGLDPAQTLKVLKQSAAYSSAMDQKGERMVKRNFAKPASALSTSYKDARLILGLGAKVDCPLPMMSLYVQALASEVSKGRVERDPATIIDFYNELAGLK